MSTVPPDFRDLPSLQQLARALYHNGSVRGAALFVGAGFSKNAIKVTPDTPDPPSWWELLNELIKQLYPANAASAPSDPLRIAEEYRSYFGQAALDGLIRTRFPDRAWLPGPLHHQLLNFPWSEILTTNWDTLLERTADGVTDFMHDVVRTEADLAHARSKRIVKLHGTLGDKDPLIFAAEDYRTYPVRHAAFVNLARQIFIENDLCLIGFSGTDPNFLEWAGWVRDNLGGNARRIYLVGCLNLSASARKYLETHNVAPIDFATLVAGLPAPERHPAATKMFFDILSEERPKAPDEWIKHPFNLFPLRRGGPDLHEKAGKDDDFAVSALDETVSLIQDERGNYPGWLVCPKGERQGLHDSAFDEFMLLRPPVLTRYEVRRRAEILDEFLWRYTMSFDRLRKPLHDALIAIMELPFGELDTHYRGRFAVALMRDARADADRTAFQKWAAIIDAEAAPEASERIEAQYQRCLFLRDEFDVVGLAKAISSIASDDPLWKLRKSGLYAEVGEHVKATKLIREAATELERSYRLNRNSIWIRSALAWASWLHRVSEMGNFRRQRDLPRARDFRELSIDPPGELEALQDAADEIRRKQQDDDAEVIPLFEPGSYRPGEIKLVAKPDEPAFGILYELDQLMEVVGIPMRLNHVQIAASAATSISRTTYNHSTGWYSWLLRALHAHLDSPFIRYFGRLAVAQLPTDATEIIRNRLYAAIKFWTDAWKRSTGEDARQDRSIALDELRLVLFAQSHMTVRMSVEEAIAAFHLGVKLAKDPDITHWWLIEAAGDLAKYALQAIPDDELGQLVLEIMEFPLAIERGGHTPTWPNLTRVITSAAPIRDPNDLRWDQRINQLLEASNPDRAGRPEAIERLAFLSTKGVLTPAESQAFARVMWAQVDGMAQPLPANTNLLESMFAQLPAPDGIDAQARVLARVLGRPLPSVMNPNGMLDTGITTEQLNQLTSLYNLGPLGLTIPAQQAAGLFDQIVAWNPSSPATRDPFGGNIIRHFNDRVRIMASDTLTFAITPALRSTDKNEIRLRNLLDFITRTKSWRAVAALPVFVETVPDLVDSVALAIHRGLSAPDHIQVSGAASALARWASLINNGVLREMPRMLIEQLLAMIETRQENLHILLDAAEALIKLNMLYDADMVRLMRALADVREETRYTAIPLDSRRAVTASLIRQKCVQIAILLRSKIADDGTLSGWIGDGRVDALPEVRFVAKEEVEPLNG